MLNKLSALLPLLGWFYLSIFAIVAVRYIFPKIFKKIEWLIWVGFGCWALVLSTRSIADEIKLYKISRETLYLSSEQKIIREIATTYEIYFKAFHQFMERGSHINVVDVSTKELYYARMYLYPAAIENKIDCDTKNSKGCIIHVSQRNRFLYYRLVGQQDDKVLLMKE